MQSLKNTETGKLRKEWSAEDKEKLLDNLHLSNRELAKMFDRTVPQIKSQKRHLITKHSRPVEEGVAISYQWLKMPLV